MKRLLAALFAAVLSLGVAACEAPGAPDEPAGVEGEVDVPEDGTLEDEAGDTQLDTGGGPAAVDDDEHEDHDEEGEVGGAGEGGEAGEGDAVGDA